jgi:hypothetical protein
MQHHAHGILVRPTPRFARPGLALLLFVAVLALLAGAIDPILALI